MTKQILFVVGLVLLVGAIYGAYQYPHSQLAVGSSTAGTTFSTAKFAGVAVNLASPGANGTSTSILNTDANDRYITNIGIGCETVGTSQTAYTGSGLARLTLSIATSSTSAPATNSSNFLVGGGALTIATTSSTAVEQFPAVAVATSSVIVNGTPYTFGTSSVSAIWPTNTYMTFTTNATNTAVCTFGVNYIGS